MKTSNRLALVFLLTLALFLIASARGASAACTTPTNASLSVQSTMSGPIFHYSIVDPIRNGQTVTYDAGPFGSCATALVYDRFGVYTNCNPVGGGKDVFYLAYDVAMGQWVATQHLIGLSNLSIAIGTSATTAGTAGYNLNNGGIITIGYAIYNPKTHLWAEGSDNAGGLSGSGGPTFVNFGVDFQMSFSTQHRRFNGSAWGAGQNSSPLAATYVNPTSGSPTLNVCLANNSVATTSYSWTFGDGGMSSSDSVQHGYTTPDLFTWNFSASGPGGGPDTATGTIKTDFAAPTNGMISINGGASCVGTNMVTLTISAMDNSGTVTQMRISNENPGTGSWEPYATSKPWNLVNTPGTRTVWIDFQDRAGNIASSSASDTVELDQTTPTVTAPASVTVTQSGPCA